MDIDDIIDDLREQRADQTFITYTAENGEVYIEPDGEPEVEADVWNQWRRDDYCDLPEERGRPTNGASTSGTPIRLGYGRIPRRAAVKSAAVIGDDASAEPDIGPVSLQATEEVSCVG
jgi:hypothetical protein